MILLFVGAVLGEIKRFSASEVVLGSGLSATLAERVVDALSAEVAVIDFEGNIVMTNAAWERFARENAASKSHNLGVGANYFETCRSACGEGADNAKEALKRVTELLSGSRPDFYLEYPCHSPTKRRWFVMHATRFDSPPIGAVL